MKTALILGGMLLLAGLARAQSAASDWQKIEGQHSGIVKPLAQAVQDPETWGRLWREHDAADPVPAVDFSRETVIAVFLGEKRTAGVVVRIVVQKDLLDGTRLNVFYREIDPKKGFSADVISQPYAIVKIARPRAIDLEPDQTVSIPEHRNPCSISPETLRALEGSAGAKFDGR